MNKYLFKCIQSVKLIDPEIKTTKLIKLWCYRFVRHFLSLW